MNTGIDIGLEISSSTTKFSEFDSELFNREYGEYKKAFQRDLRVLGKG